MAAATGDDVLVNDIISTINSANDSDLVHKVLESTSKTSKNKIKKDENQVKGIPKSGRFWKSKKEKFSSVNKTKGLKQSFEKKNALRKELERVKELSKQLKEQKKEEIEKKKERRRDNLKKAEENRKKAEIVQVITNTAKLKRLRKKQLRFIEKRDTNDLVNKNK